MSLKLNVGGADRIIRLLLGVALIGLAYFGVLTGWGAIIACVVAAIALITSVVGFCPAYAILGFNSCRRSGR